MKEEEEKLFNLSRALYKCNNPLNNNHATNVNHKPEFEFQLTKKAANILIQQEGDTTCPTKYDKLNLRIFGCHFSHILFNLSGKVFDYIQSASGTPKGKYGFWLGTDNFSREIECIITNKRNRYLIKVIQHIGKNPNLTLLKFNLNILMSNLNRKISKVSRGGRRRTHRKRSSCRKRSTHRKRSSCRKRSTHRKRSSCRKRSHRKTKSRRSRK